MINLLLATAGQCGLKGPTTATQFTYEDLGNNVMKIETHLDHCNKKYILYPRAESPPDLGAEYSYFGVPLQKVALTETVTNTFFEELDIVDHIKVASPLSTSSCLAKKLEDGSTTAYVSSGDAHVAQMADAEIEAVVTSPYNVGAGQPHHVSQPHGAKVICESSTADPSPLASAEWVKFWGYFFGKSTEAEASFCATESRYTCNSLVAKQKNVDSVAVPKVVFASAPSQWGAASIAMPPFKDIFVHDAGGVYPDMSAYESYKKLHFSGTQVSGYDFTGDTASFHAALKEADVIVDETWPHGQTLASIAEAYQLPKLRVGQSAKFAESDDPGTDQHGWALVSHGVGEKLFTIDETGTVVGELAESATHNGDGSWTIALKAGHHFSDGSPVTAADVVTCIGRTNGMNSAARSITGTMTLVAEGDLTVKITSENPTNFMQNVLASYMFAVYKGTPAVNNMTATPPTKEGGHVFTGPYAIHSDTVLSASNKVIELVPNTFYPNANHRTPITLKLYGSGDDVAKAIIDDEIDMAFFSGSLPPNDLAALNWNAGISIKSFAVGYQYYMFMNTKRASLSDVKVRKALALALDRQALAEATTPPGMPAEAVAASVATGAFPSSSSWGAAHSKLEFNKAQAATLLDEAGWVLVDGKRTKDGVKLTLDIVLYKWRADLVAMAPHIVQMFGDLGIDATAREKNDGGYIEESGGIFDLLLWAQDGLASGGNDPLWFYDTFAKTGPATPAVVNIADAQCTLEQANNDECCASNCWTGQNFAQYSSANIDAKIAALAAAQGADRIAAEKAVRDAVVDEVPFTVLTAATWHVAVTERTASYTPYGSDYHVIQKTMPASDWPKAFVNGRVYALDGTMDKSGPPYGGTDWYQTRVAQPDGFLSDLIDVLHPTGADYAPAGMKYLRHVETGTNKLVTAADTCPSPVHAQTCEALAAAASDGALKNALVAETAVASANEAEALAAANALAAAAQAEKEAALAAAAAAAEAEKEAALAAAEAAAEAEKEAAIAAEQAKTTQAPKTQAPTTQAPATEGQAAAEPVDNTALFVVIGVLAGTTIIAVIAAAAWLLGKAMATPPPATKGGKAANAV